MKIKNLFITYTSQELWTLYALACEKKINPKESCILALFDFELIGIDQDIKISREELLAEFKRMGFKIERKLFWSNRLAMAQEVIKSRTEIQFIRRAIFNAVQLARDFDVKKLRQFNGYERIFITGPSHPLSALILQNKPAEQQVLMFPETLWMNVDRMRLTAKFQKLDFIAFDSKSHVSDFYKSHLSKRMKLEKQLSRCKDRSILIFPEYVEPLIRRDEYVNLYISLFEKLQANNFSSFIFKFHPRSTKADNKFFLKSLKKKAGERWNIEVVDSCLDLQLWATACREIVARKISAAATVSSTAAEVFAAEIGLTAYYSKELYKELYVLNPAAQEGLPTGPQDGPNILFI